MKGNETVRSSASGFSLVELAIVLIILALLAGGMFSTLGAQQDIANLRETEKRLNGIHDALLGFAAANGRLPCPAASATTGIEAPAGGGDCTNDWNGFVPAITLGIQPSDAQGYALDAWNNRIRYAVSIANSSAFTTENGIKGAWSSTLSPDLRVCTTASSISGTGATAACGSGTESSNNVVAIVLSVGKNGTGLPTGADEIANGGSSRAFVSHPPTPASAAGGAFDDIIVWISPNILYNRMISAGRLP